jgi:hypothetical protein
VKLHEALRTAWPADVEAGRQSDHRAGDQLDHGNDQVRAADPVRIAARRHAFREEVPAARLDCHGRAEERGHDGKRIHADVDEHTHLVEGDRGGMPRLDAAPVHIRVDGSNGPELAAPDDRPDGLLRLAEERRWRAGKPDVLVSG